MVSTNYYFFMELLQVQPLNHRQNDQSMKRTEQTLIGSHSVIKKLNDLMLVT